MTNVLEESYLSKVKIKIICTYIFITKNYCCYFCRYFVYKKGDKKKYICCRYISITTYSTRIDLKPNYLILCREPCLILRRAVKSIEAII